MPDVNTVIVGTGFKGVAALNAVEAMQPGHPIRLARDPGNRYDPNAVVCFYLATDVGFVPKVANGRLARAMDAGAQPTAVVTAPATVRAGRVRVEPKIKITWPD